MKKIDKKEGYEKVGRKQLAKNISHLEGISLTSADRIIDQVFRNILYLIIEKKIVDIPGFGRFQGKYIPSRKGSHPQSHKEITIEDRIQVKLETSSTLKNFLKGYVEQFRKEDEQDEQEQDEQEQE